VTANAALEPRHPITFLVVFENRPARGGFRLLRAGFRHCFCLARVSEGWVLCDPRSDRLLLRSAPPIAALTLARSYAALGATVVALRRPPGAADGAPRRWLAPLSCVEIVKRVIGCGRRGVFTPLGLYRLLRGHPETIFLVSPRTPDS
jgi:hypothetical protein